MALNTITQPDPNQGLMLLKVIGNTTIMIGYNLQQHKMTVPIGAIKNLKFGLFGDVMVNVLTLSAVDRGFEP